MAENPFAKYATPAAPQANPFAKYAQPTAEQKPNVFMDVGASAGAGAVRGAAETVMLPVTLGRGAQWLTDNTVGRVSDYVFDEGVDPLVRAIMGKPQLSDAEKSQRREVIKTARRDGNYLIKAQDKARGVMDDNLYAPKTTAGEYARTVGEFAVPGAWLSKGSKLARAAEVLVPAVTSETAGQLFEGGSMEGPARVAGALLGGGLTAAGRARVNAPDTAVRNSAKGVTPEQMAEAERIKNIAVDQGINLTGPQAIQQATNGSTKLGDLQRVVEGSQRGGAVMQPYFSPVPQQVDAATGRVLDSIAPQSANPSTLGPRAADVAAEVISDKREAINARFAPRYEKASREAVTPDTPVTTTRNSPILGPDGNPIPVSETKMVPTPLSDNPRFGPALDWVRGNLPELKDYADNSVEIADAVSKRLRDVGDAAANSSNSTFSNQVAGYAGGVSQEVRGAARNAVSEYDHALNAQRVARKNGLEPLEQGPIGRIANAKTTQGVTAELLPKQPLTGGEQELMAAIMRIGEKDPELASSLVRQGLGDAYDQSAKKLVGGDNYYGGARFAKDVAGTAQQEMNLGAVLRGLPGQRNPETFSDYLTVLRATGQRKPIGSQTAFNAETMKDLGTGSAAQRAGSLARTLGASAVTNASDITSRIWLGKNVEALADMFVDPQSVARIKEILAKAEATPLRDAAGQAAVTAPQQGRDRKKGETQ